MVFTAAQLEALRAEYARINSIDPCGEAYPKLVKWLDRMPQEMLAQLAGAQIKFVSNLARNRVSR
jgi:hypothetical protein